MVVVEKALYEVLKTLASSRVYVMRAPQSVATPYIVFMRSGGIDWRHINGPDDITQAFFEVHCYGTNFYETRELANEVRGLLDGYRGNVEYGDSPTITARIAGISYQDDSDVVERDKDPFLYRNLALYLVTYAINEL